MNRSDLIACWPVRRAALFPISWVASIFWHQKTNAHWQAPVILFCAIVLGVWSFDVRSAGDSVDALGAGSDPPVIGNFDLATVEDLALFFAEESVRRLRVPLTVRLFMGGISKKEEIEKIRRNPPKADKDSVVYPCGDSNPLSFAYDPEACTLTAWERMIKKRGRIGLWGLTGPEAAAALNAKSSQHDWGGADFAFDRQRDAPSFRIVYRLVPTDRNRFYQEIDRLVSIQLKWSKGQFVKEMTAIVEERAPPDSATATTDGFRATVALRHFSAEPEETGQWVWRYVQSWSRPPPGPPPRLISDTEVRFEQPLHAFVHFEGAVAGEKGQARVDAAFRLIGPDGQVLLENPKITAYQGETPPRGHLQLGDRGATVSLGVGEPPGDYRMEMRVCDTVTNRCVDLIHPVTLISGEA